MLIALSASLLVDNVLILTEAFNVLTERND